MSCVPLRYALFQHDLILQDASPTVDDVQSNNGQHERLDAHLPRFSQEAALEGELLLALTVGGINGRLPFRPATGHIG
jgi:hypothetical protein